MAVAKYKKNKHGRYEAKIWDGTYNPDGTKHRKYISSTKSSADLERKVEEFRRKRDKQEVTTPSTMSIYEYAQYWLSIAKATRAENTQEMYERTIRKLEFLDDTRIADVQHYHFQQAINNHLEHPRTCEQIYITFKQIVRYASIEHIITKSAYEDVITDISLPDYRKKPKRPLTLIEKEAIKTVSDLSPMKDCLIGVLYYLGVRRGEALALTPADFNWDNKTVSISKVIVFIKNKPKEKPYPKTDNGLREIPLPEAFISRYRDFIESSGESYIFHGQTASIITYDAFRRMWESIITSLNKAMGYNPYKKDRGEPPIVGLTPHIFRHNYCTELCYQVPMISTKKIAKLMGDTEKMVLDMYSHIIEEKEDITGVLDVF